MGQLRRWSLLTSAGRPGRLAVLRSLQEPKGSVMLDVLGDAIEDLAPQFPAGAPAVVPAALVTGESVPDRVSVDGGAYFIDYSRVTPQVEARAGWLNRSPRQGAETPRAEPPPPVFAGESTEAIGRPFVGGRPEAQPAARPQNGQPERAFAPLPVAAPVAEPTQCVGFDYGGGFRFDVWYHRVLLADEHVVLGRNVDHRSGARCVPTRREVAMLLYLPGEDMPRSAFYLGVNFQDVQNEYLCFRLLPVATGDTPNE